MVAASAGDGVTAAIAAIVCVLTIGCVPDGQSAPGDAGHDMGDVARDAVQDSGSVFYCPAGNGAPTYAPTFGAIYCEILLQHCALAFCHASESDYFVISDKNEAHGALVNAPATGPCASTGLNRVDPGHPESSVLYLKVTGPPCGARMPILYGDVSGMLETQAIDQIRQWIEAGALNN